MDENQYTELAIKMENIDARSKSNTHRIEDLESDMKETKEMQITLIKLANGVENMGTQLTDVKKGLYELSDKVTILENSPAQDTKKRWDFITGQLLWLFISGIAGFLFARILPGIFL